MANMQERLDNAIIKTENNSAKFHEIINGNDELSVQTENGLVPSVAKKYKDIEENISIKVDNITTDVISYKDETLNIKNQTQVIFENTAIESSNAKDEADRAFLEANRAKLEVEKIIPENLIANSILVRNSDNNAYEAVLKDSLFGGLVKTDLSNVSEDKGVLVEYWENTNSFCRKYSDGFMFQGGLKPDGSDTVNFQYPFVKCYNVLCSMLTTGSAGYVSYVNSFTNTYAKFMRHGTGDTIAENWIAFGRWK